MARPQGGKRPAPDRAGASPAKRHKGAGGGARPAYAAKGGKPGGKPGAKPGAKPHVPEKLNRKERKELDRARKARKHKNFNLIQEVVLLWEEARRQDITAEKRSKLVSAIMGKIQGRIAELAGSHSASRVIQTCAKHGTPAERATILKELEPKLLELSKSPYGHFVVTKLVSLAPKEQLPGLLKAFRGHLGELLRHPAGNHVVDDLYAVADARQRNLMAAEFYGKEYVLFEGGTLNNAEGAPAHLAELMARVDGAKQRSIIQHMSKDLIPIMEKGLVDCPLVHRLLAEFMEFSPASVVADAAENLSGDPLLHMVHTKDGAKAACMTLAYGTAKDRKKALKCMKGHVGAMARDEWGHLALITALSVVDDTTLLRKSIVVELQKDLAELAEHKYGYRVLAQLLHPWCGRYLPPQLAAVARPPSKEYSAEAMRRPQHEVVAAAKAAAEEEEEEQQGADGAAESDDDEEGGAGGRATSGPLGLSKKDPDVRRKELMGGGAPASLAAALCALCAQQAGQLVRSQHGSDILVEVCRGGESGLLLECLGEGAQEQLAAVHDALVAAVAGSGEAAAADDDDEEEGAQQQQQEPVLSHFFGSRALRRLVLASSDGGAAGEAAAAFAGKLWRGALAGQCKQWVDTHAAKVIAAVLHCGDAATKQAAAKELKPLVKGCSLDEWADRLTSKKGEGKQHGKQQQGKKQAGKQQQQAAKQPGKQQAAQQQPSAKKRKQKA
ncbi:pumilio-like protein 24 [Chlorella sorokiniana]|uniref:Pumilio-like protein 24 n=1 Tax=Chlorella sorokiniana TaxID=3076 RepID=A0A2P6U5M2_CHLSO|nr:pumilio-like protein 24 [Chlorella sorokiniana]|eukprot:PRW61613.1 pumilio-like protein 24 [Chlorella sorokiniana]